MGWMDLFTGILAQTTQAASPGLWQRMFPQGSVALTALIICLVAATGLGLGSVRFHGFSLGIPGVMFTGLIIGKLLGTAHLSEPVITFVRDFGLILFVYAVGAQVGPGFFASLRAQGMWWNLLAVTIVLSSAILCVIIALVLPGIGIHGAVGLFAGATTNAPAFGSATEAIRTVAGEQAPQLIRGLASPAFAISYPFGLLGVIVAMVLTRVIFRTSPAHEAELAEALERGNRIPPSVMNVEMQNTNLNGLSVDRIEQLQGRGIVISRVMQKNTAGKVCAPRPEMKVSMGDVVLAVGAPQELEAFRLIAGRQSEVDLRSVPGEITTRQILVTHRPVLNKTVDELNLQQRLGVTITRVRRGDVQFTAVGHIELQFGDRVQAVGEASSLDAAAKELGDSLRELNLPRLLPIFVGLLIGVAVGSFPVAVPGLPVPVKLGLAAGPMIVAILLARLGRFGSLIWYMPYQASQLMRELGITLFLICVGLLAGPSFFDKLFSTLGLEFLVLGVVVTLAPLLAVALLARYWLKMNYLHICGLLAGSYTSPSLAYVHEITTSEAPAVAFATVYPLTMILRVLMGQILVLVFAGM